MEKEKAPKRKFFIMVSIISFFIIGFFAGDFYGDMVFPKRENTMKMEQQPETEGKKERKIKYWQAPMNPSYIRDKPGKSPMGMDLVPVYEDKEDNTKGGRIKIDPVTVQNMGVRTERVRKGRLEKIIRSVGHLDYDERKIGYVTTKVSGWIEKLYVDYTGQKVKKGDRLFKLYSPELVSAQEEYLLSLRGGSYKSTKQTGNSQKRLQSLYSSAKQRLKYWDISDKQIKELKRTGIIKKALTIYSPFNGYVVHKNIFEGQYQKAGTNLYKIADLSSIWVYVHIYEYELPWIKIGQWAEMELSYIPGKIFKGKITYMYPYLSKKTRDVKVRLEFSNPDLELKPEMYANVRIKSIMSEETIIAPEEAVINTGSRQIVYVSKGKGKFEPRDVTVGVEGAGGVVQILAGLSEGETVVTSGQFLIDSESKLQEAIQKMLAPKSETKDD